MGMSDKQHVFPVAAIDTVARFAGMTVTEVLMQICSKMQGWKDTEELLRTNGLHKHARAISSVCRYAGVDMERLGTRIAKHRQAMDGRDQSTYKKVA
jgi:hypothetical protein